MQLQIRGVQGCIRPSPPERLGHLTGEGQQPSTLSGVWHLTLQKCSLQVAFYTRMASLQLIQTLQVRTWNFNSVTKQAHCSKHGSTWPTLNQGHAHGLLRRYHDNAIT